MPGQQLSRVHSNATMAYSTSNARPPSPPLPSHPLCSRKAANKAATKAAARAREEGARYDLRGAMQRQGGFLRHVLRSCYNELPFLQRALDRYIRFVLLWRDSPGLVVVPMYDQVRERHRRPCLHVLILTIHPPVIIITSRSSIRSSRISGR